MNKLIAILPLIAMVFTIGLVSSAEASNWSGNQSLMDGFADGNISENTATADRKDLRPHTYGTDSKSEGKLYVCGLQLCGEGQSVTLSKYADYSGLVGERKHIDTI